jgi:hypothetical protein
LTHSIGSRFMGFTDIGSRCTQRPLFDGFFTSVSLVLAQTSLLPLVFRRPQPYPCLSPFLIHALPRRFRHLPSTDVWTQIYLGRLPLYPDDSPTPIPNSSLPSPNLSSAWLPAGAVDCARGSSWARRPAGNCARKQLGRLEAAPARGAGAALLRAPANPQIRARAAAYGGPFLSSLPESELAPTPIPHSSPPSPNPSLAQSSCTQGRGSARRPARAEAAGRGGLRADAAQRQADCARKRLGGLLPLLLRASALRVLRGGQRGICDIQLLGSACGRGGQRGTCARKLLGSAACGRAEAAGRGGQRARRPARGRGSEAGGLRAEAARRPVASAPPCLCSPRPKLRADGSVVGLQRLRCICCSVSPAALLPDGCLPVLFTSAAEASGSIV